jgi:ribosomal-protein-alanine N-acetyltransferase
MNAEASADRSDAAAVEIPERLSPLLSKELRKLVLAPVPEPVEILTPRLRLRELTLDDHRHLEVSLSDREHRRYVLPYQHGEAYVDRTLLIGLLAARTAPRTFHSFAIDCRESGRFLGSCGIGIRNGWNQRAVVGLEIAASAASNGVGTEAVRALVEFAFTRLGVDEVLAELDSRNVPCLRVMEKAGLSPVRLSPWQRWALCIRFWANMPYARCALTHARWKALRASD